MPREGLWGHFKSVLQFLLDLVPRFLTYFGSAPATPTDSASMETPSLKIDEEKTKDKINQDLERIRVRALQNAEAKLRLSTAGRTVPFPPRVQPQDSGTTYDVPGCLEILKTPVVLNDLSAEELEKPLSLMSTGIKMGVASHQVPGGSQTFTLKFMSLLTELHSKKAMYTAMVRSGLAGMIFGGQLSMGAFPEEQGFGFLQAAIDLVVEEPTSSKAFLHGLQCLSVFLENGGPTYIAKFHEVRALKPFIAKFVGSEFTLDDLLLPMDLNVPGWMHKVLDSLVAPFKFQAMFGVMRNPPAIPESKHTMETMIESGALRKVLDILAFMVGHVDEVPRDTRLIDFCKMLENLTTVLANSSNEQKLFLDELQSVPEFADSLFWIIKNWDYSLTASHTALLMVWRMMENKSPEDKVLPLNLVARDRFLDSVAKYIDDAPPFRAAGPTGPINLLPDIFLSFLSLGPLPPSAITPNVTSTLARIATGNDSPGSKAKASDLLRRFTENGSISPEDLPLTAQTVAAVFGEVQLSCDQCGAMKPPEELKKCSRCKGVRYCSIDCQRAGWKEHKKVCVAPPA